MEAEATLFRRIETLIHRDLVSCGEEDSLLAAADRMRAENVSSILVLRDGMPVGIVTDRDLRRKLPDICAAGGRMSVAALMSAPVCTLAEGTRLFEALHFLARRKIHHVVVVGADDGRPLGMLSDTDLLFGQMDAPIFFSRSVEEAATIDELRAVTSRMAKMVALAWHGADSVAQVAELVTHFYDAVTSRAIELTLSRSAPGLEGRFAFLVLGSEGRKEQTLKTDQDNAIVHDDDLSEDELTSLARFSEELIGTLTHIGVPACPKHTTADNPKWRKSVSAWRAEVEGWISAPSPEALVNFGMFCDFRTIYGPQEHERSIKEAIFSSLERNQVFLTYMARNILRFPPPLSLMGRFKTEREAPHAGEIDLKKAGFFTMSEGLTLLALEAGFLEGSTQEKIGRLLDRKALSPATAEKLTEAYDLFLRLRLRHQLAQAENGVPPDNFVNPKALSLPDRTAFKAALRFLRLFQRHLREQFQVDLIPI